MCFVQGGRGHLTVNHTSTQGLKGLKTYNKQLISTDSIVIYLIAKQIKTVHIKLLENKNKIFNK